MNSLNQLSRQLLYQLGGEKYRLFLDVYRAWKPIVGDLLAERSYPFKYERGVAYIGVKNSTWMQELILLKHNIINQYNHTYHIPVHEIVFMLKT